MWVFKVRTRRVAGALAERCEGICSSIARGLAPDVGIVHRGVQAGGASPARPDGPAAASQRLDHLRPNVATQRLQDAPTVDLVALLACLFFEQRDEAFEGNLAAFHFCPGIGVAVARIEAANEIFGKSDLGLIAIEGFERARKDHAAEIPQHREGGSCMANIHGGATLFTLFLP
jgi:hypothetical protein